MHSQTTSALPMRSRAFVLRSYAWTPSHRSPATRWMSCAIPATPQLGAPLRGCKSSSGKPQRRPARRSCKVTSSWQHSRSTCRPDETTKSLAIATAHALVQRVLATRSDLRRAHELAELNGFDAVTNLMMPTTPPIYPFPSAAPTAPGSAPATTTNSTSPPIHPLPSAAPTAPDSALAMTTTTMTTTEGAGPPTNHVTPTHPTSHLHPPIHPPPGHSTDGPWPDLLDLYTQTSTGASTTTPPTPTNPKQRSETDGEM